jgi:hypothetical protein
MNEEALKYSYELFVQDGYNGTFDDYKKLMNNNNEAFEYSYDLFKNDGYNGDLNKFSELLNVGKTPAVVEEVATVTAENNQATVTDSVSVDGSSESLEVKEEVKEPSVIKLDMQWKV